MFIFDYISGLKRLKKPLLDLNTARTSPELASVYYVAALPGGEAVITNYIWNNKTCHVLRLDSQGKLTQVIYSCVHCYCISGLLVLGDHLYIIRANGTVIETCVSNGRVLKIATIPDVRFAVHTGSLYSKLDRIPDKQTLLLCDLKKGEVFTFKLSTGQKQVRITGLSSPKSVSYFFHDQTVFYIVCEEGSFITVYNQTWDLVRTIGTRGSNDGELRNPMSAVVSDEDTIIVIDGYNSRISEFSFNGTFLRHLVSSDGINRPYSMSYYYPHLWVVNGYTDKLYRYNLYR